mmetsp:Transcript_2192/g.4714  ORF Transcript_2192/g.4714 Transcript_2192/m.4714 type:complete len:103 (+) Transcript_2192:851-1159(+)
MEKAHTTTATAALNYCLIQLLLSLRLLHHLVLMMTPPTLDEGPVDEGISMTNQITESVQDTDHSLKGNLSLDIVKKNTAVNGRNTRPGKRAHDTKSLEKEAS